MITLKGKKILISGVGKGIILGSAYLFDDYERLESEVIELAVDKAASMVKDRVISKSIEEGLLVGPKQEQVQRATYEAIFSVYSETGKTLINEFGEER